MTCAWITDYVQARGTGEASFRRALVSLLQRYQADYVRLGQGVSFLESLSSTRFLRLWVTQPPYSRWSQVRRRAFLACLRGFTAWLLREGRSCQDVYFYLQVYEVVQGRVETLELRDDLQRHILALRLPRDWALGAHNYNRYRSRPAAPSDEKECLLEWMQHLARTVLPRRAPRWISGLARAFEQMGRRELCQILEGCHSVPTVLRGMASGLSSVEALRAARKPAFESGLAGWLEGLLQHRAGRQMKPGSWASELRRLDRIACRHGVRQPEQLNGPMLEEFLRSPQPRTRNGRLSKLRALARFLAPRGSCLDLSGWRPVPEPPFRPHLYTLHEIGRLLEGFRCCGREQRAFYWLGIETVVFLLYACGLRRREPLGLRVQDVRFEEQALFLHHTKFYKQRWVPLGPGGLQRLARYAEERRLLFPDRFGADEPFFLTDRGMALSKHVLELAFVRVRRALGLKSRGTRPEPRLHDLRHSLAVHRLYQWYSEGLDVQNKLPLLSAYLGHDRLHHTEVYLHLTEDLIRQAGRSFQASFERIVGPLMRPGDS